MFYKNSTLPSLTALKKHSPSQGYPKKGTVDLSMNQKAVFTQHKAGGTLE